MNQYTVVAIKKDILKIAISAIRWIVSIVDQKA